MTRPLVVLVGRPNVGKSTLFNRFVTERRKAIVYDQPGVTRDCNYAKGAFHGMHFDVVDTPGLKDSTFTPLTPQMQQNAQEALKQATLVLFMIDAKDGVTPFDEELANDLRLINAPVVVIVNKSEGQNPDLDSVFLEAQAMGFKTVIQLSAKHKLGFDDLYHAMATYLPRENEEEKDPDAVRPVQLAIIGRPNVGKSTIINQLLGDSKLLTHDEAGVTRDATYHTLDWKGQLWTLIDTAGLRRKSNVTGELEKMMVDATEHSIRFAEITGIVIEAETLLEKQDLVIAQHIVSEGRAIFFIVNKMDKMPNPAVVRERLMHQLQSNFAQIKGMKVIYMSAIKDNLSKRVFDAAQTVYNMWNLRVPTAKLNQWLSDALETHPLPIKNGRRLKIKYITQVKTRPPTFALFSSRAADIPSDYLKYLENSIRDTFNMTSVPMRLYVRQPKNPYVDKRP